MEEIYLVTGATGFLGHFIVEKLKEQGRMIVGLRLPGDKAHLSEGVTYEIGDITKPYTLHKFFSHGEGKKSVVIHCAGLVSIVSNEERLWNVNVDGTRNIIDLCEKYGINRLTYVSSVHAIPDEGKGTVIREPKHCLASLVVGDYGKSKAEATLHVKRAAKSGLDTVIAYPSGLVGPQDYAMGYMTEVIRAYLKGCLPAAVKGGYDFVDVRDAAEGVIACSEKGMRGEGYILSGEYIAIKEMFDILSRVSGKRYV